MGSGKLRGEEGVGRTGLYSVLSGAEGGWLQSGMEKCGHACGRHVSCDVEGRTRLRSQFKTTQELPQGRSGIAFAVRDQEESRCNSPIIAVCVDLI